MLGGVIDRRQLRRALGMPEVADEALSYDPSIEPVLALLRTHSGQDFRHYKPSTLMRRIHRRMGLHTIEKLGAYEEFLRTSLCRLRSIQCCRRTPAPCAACWACLSRKLQEAMTGLPSGSLACCCSLRLR